MIHHRLATLVLLLAAAGIAPSCSGGGGDSGSPAPPATAFVTYEAADIHDAPGTSSPAGYAPYRVRIYASGRTVTWWTRSAGTLVFDSAALPGTAHGWTMTYCQVTDQPNGDVQLQVSIANGSGTAEPNVSWTFILVAPTAGS